MNMRKISRGEQSPVDASAAHTPLGVRPGNDVSRARSRLDSRAGDERPSVYVSRPAISAGKDRAAPRRFPSVSARLPGREICHRPALSLRGNRHLNNLGQDHVATTIHFHLYEILVPVPAAADFLAAVRPAVDSLSEPDSLF
jgi:hypothetical protein